MKQVIDTSAKVITLYTLKSESYTSGPVGFETKEGHRGILVTNPMREEFAILSAVFMDKDTFRGIAGNSWIGVIEKALTAGITVFVFDEPHPVARDHNAWIFMSKDARLASNPCNCESCRPG